MTDYLAYINKEQLISQEGKIVCVLLNSGKEYIGIPTYFNGYFELKLPIEVMYNNNDLTLVSAVKCSPEASINFKPSDVMAIPKLSQIYTNAYSEKVASIHGAHVWGENRCQKS